MKRIGEDQRLRTGILGTNRELEQVEAHGTSVRLKMTGRDGRIPMLAETETATETDGTGKMFKEVVRVNLGWMLIVGASLTDPSLNGINNRSPKTSLASSGSPTSSNFLNADLLRGETAEIIEVFASHGGHASNDTC